jgi:hypothetical protein
MGAWFAVCLVVVVVAVAAWIAVRLRTVLESIEIWGGEE